MSNKKKYKVGSLFAGVGGICQGFKNSNCEVIWANELDNNACITYQANHVETKLLKGDINEIDLKQFDKVDIVTAGFPCQPFSSAGLKKGFDDERGQVFYRVIDILNHIKPKAFLLENVKNLVTHSNGDSFAKVRNAILKSGYSFIPFVLKSDEYCDVPQARERLYIVGFAEEHDFSYDHPVKINNLNCDGDYISSRFSIPERETNKVRHVKDFLDGSHVHPSDYYEKPDNHIHTRVMEAVGSGCKDSVYQYRRKYVRQNKSNVCPTLTANMGGGGHNVPIIHDGEKVRRLNPRECFNLQGFSEDFVLPSISRGQLYKQAGNSVVIPVIEKIANKIIKALDENTKYTA